jgi:hypothetical protein
LVCDSFTARFPGSRDADSAHGPTSSAHDVCTPLDFVSCGAPAGNQITCTNTYPPTPADGAGYYTETATFFGDANYTASSSTQQNNFAINQASSAMSLASTVNPSTYGQPVTFTATIDAENGNVRGRANKGRKPLIVSGSVTWSSNTGCGTTPVTAGYPGTATCTTSALPAGTNTVTASYSGDGNHGGSSATLSSGQVVNQGSQFIAVKVAPPPQAQYHSSFTVVATGGGSGNPLVFTSSGTCINSGATYTITLKSGICSVYINQAGNNNYMAAATATYVLRSRLRRTSREPMPAFRQSRRPASHATLDRLQIAARGAIRPR